MNELVNYINDRVSRFIKRSDILNATPATVISVEDGNWATISILSNGSIYRLKNLSGSPLAEGQSCQVYYKKNLSQNNAYIGAVNSEIQPSLSQIISFETINKLGVRSGEKYKISEVSFICHSLDKCYFSFSSSIKGVVDNDIILYLYVDNVETGIVFTQTLSIDHSENVSFYMPIEIQATGKHTITIKADGQCDVLNVASYVYGVNLTKPDSRLPDDYQEVEYLESSGTQYIDTGCKFDNQYSYTIDCEIDNENGNQMFGMKWWYAHAVFIRNNKYYVCNTENYVYDTLISAGNRVVINISLLNKTINVDYSDIHYSHSFNDFNPSSSIYPVVLGACWTSWNDKLSEYGKGKIYSFKYYEKGILLRDMIPVIRKSDNKPGMYDKVSQTFYTNQGTGEFIIP